MDNKTLIRTLLLGMALLLTPITGAKSELAPALRKELVRHGQPERFNLYQVGRATWYGEQFHGRLTASGEQFDMFQLTAAHRDLPLGSKVRVTHLRSRRSVVVRINDRGPVSAHSIIDLSYGAAKNLGLVELGLARVRLDLMKRRKAEDEEPAQVTGGE